MKEKPQVVSPQEAEEIAAESNNPFTSPTAKRIFDRIARATQKSKGEAVEFQVTGGETSLKELVTKKDKEHMQAALESEGWSLKLKFIEGEEDPGHYAPGWQNLLDVVLKPLTKKKK